jgi:hypothetical protein
MSLIRNNGFLWTLQILLAVVFLFAGYVKLVMPADQLVAQGPLPAWFLRGIAVLEILGACGLILPQLTGIQPQLTPVAAAGLVIIMIGATTVTLMTMTAAAALIPFCVGVLAAIVAVGRRPRPRRELMSAA